MTNSVEPDETAVTEFFSLADVGSLKEFRSRQAITDTAFAKALAHQIDSWTTVLGQNDATAFEPGKYISRDLSAAMHGDRPVIFMGTNFWASKRWLTSDDLLQRMRGYENRIAEIAAMREHNLCFIVVPEKDVVIDTIAGKTESLVNLNASMDQLRPAAGSHGFLYRQLFDELPVWSSIDEYQYADSHLLARDYFIYFQKVLAHLGLPQVSRSEIAFRLVESYGDLNSKFDEPLTGALMQLAPRFAQVDGKLEQSGSRSFENPLADTTQKFFNPDPLFDYSVEVFGDSHSSIIDTRKLTYLFASCFRECTFYWNPYGVRGGALDLTADVIVMEISQRFLC